MKSISKKEKQRLNLKVLISEYRERGRALRGYRKLMKAIQGKKDKYLQRTLRNHESKPIVMQSEIEFRDEVDHLLKFYSFVEMAILTSYVNPDLTAALKSEIKTILGNTYVVRYYTTYYPLVLPQLLHNDIVSGRKRRAVGDSVHFVELLVLDRMIDDDVENFLWLLDSGRFDEYSIWHLRQTLKDRRKVGAILSKPKREETAADSAFWGFIKFTDYMQAYAGLLKRCENDLLRSLLWHHQAYWFERMQELLANDYIGAIRDVKTLNNKTGSSEFTKNITLSKRRTTSEESPQTNNANLFNEWKISSELEVENAIRCVKYNLDNAHGEALRGLLRS